MQIKGLTEFLLDDDECAAMYEVCASALEHNLLDGAPLSFALAIVEIFSESDLEPEPEQTILGTLQ